MGMHHSLLIQHPLKDQDVRFNNGLLHLQKRVVYHVDIESKCCTIPSRPHVSLLFYGFLLGRGVKAASHTGLWPLSGTPLSVLVDGSLWSSFAPWNVTARSSEPFVLLVFLLCHHFLFVCLEHPQEKQARNMKRTGLPIAHIYQIGTAVIAKNPNLREVPRDPLSQWVSEGKPASTDDRTSSIHRGNPLPGTVFV
jgi:hypothetical protein